MTRRIFAPSAADKAPAIKDEVSTSTNEMANLPNPTWDREGELSAHTRWSGKPEEGLPSIIYRTDEKKWVQPTVGWLRQSLYDPRLDPEWYLNLNPIGNLAICVADESPIHDLWYVGYIDVVTGKVELWDGDLGKLQAFADNYPWGGTMLTNP